jgi:caffeoyl-CoA O-methyltransferase
LTPDKYKSVPSARITARTRQNASKADPATRGIPISGGSSYRTGLPHGRPGRRIRMVKLGLATALVATWPAVRGHAAARRLGAVRRLTTAERVERYAQQHSTPEPAMLTAVADETRAVSRQPFMIVGSLQGELLATLVHALRPRTVLEIGTFTGYSALAMARALPPQGRIVSCEIDPVHAEVARRHVAASPYAHQIEIALGPALDTIAGLPGPFDLVFIDADKTGYVDYYEAVLPRLAPHGVIAVDNTLHGGLTVPDDAAGREMIEALLRFNTHVAEDPRVDQVVLPLRDGLTLIRPATGGTETP